MNIAFVIRSLRGGGAEKVLVLLANGLAARGRDVSVILLAGEAESAFALDAKVRRFDLDKALPDAKRSFVGRIRANARWHRLIRSTLQSLRPDVVVSFVHMVNIRVLAAAWGTGVPVVVSEHLDARLVPLPYVWETARYLLYRRAARVVSVSRGVDAFFDWLPAGRRTVIYNPVLISETSQPTNLNCPSDCPLLVSMGRLETVKGFDMLIDAFGRLTKSHPDWHLVILGEGSERERLTRQIEERRLVDKVHLPGFVENPEGILRKCSLFVMSSRREGFSLALGEAMAVGLPVVSFNCPSGPSELIDHGTNGILVEPESTSKLAEALSDLMGDAQKRRKLGDAARQGGARFSLTSRLDEWENLLSQVIQERLHT